MLHRQLQPWTPRARISAFTNACQWAGRTTTSSPHRRCFTIRRGFQSKYSEIGGSAGAIVFPESSSTPTDTLLKTIRPISAKVARNEETALLLFTPSFAARLAYDTDFVLKVIERLFKRPSPVYTLRLAVAVIDRIPTPSDPLDLQNNVCPVGDIGHEGMAYHLLDKLDSIKGSVATRNGVTGERTGGFLTMELENKNILGHPSNLARPWSKHPHTEVQIPLANTVFQTERETLLQCYDYSRIRGPWILDTTYPASTATVMLRPMDDVVCYHNTILTPLVPLTAPRVIEASMGNIIRQIQKDEGVALASTELEAAVNAYFKYSRKPASQVAVWALVIDQKLMSELSKDEVPMPPTGLASLTTNQADSMLSEMEVRPEGGQNVYANLGPILRRGGRLHRVVSGGGGWGKKAGLLSIDPAVKFEQDAVGEDAPWSPVPANENDEMNSALGNPAQAGDSIQFFLASSEQDVTPPLNVTFNDSWTIDIGAIPSTIDTIPLTQTTLGTEKQALARYIPQHFGALSEKGFSLARRSYDDRSNLNWTQTMIDVPFSRFNRRWGDRIPNPNSSRSFHSSARTLNLLSLDTERTRDTIPDTRGFESELIATYRALADAAAARKQAAAALQRGEMPAWATIEPISPEHEKLNHLRALPFPVLVSHFKNLAAKAATLQHQEIPQFWYSEGFSTSVVHLLIAYCRNNAELPEDLLKSSNEINFKLLRQGAKRPGLRERQTDYYKKWTLVRSIVAQLKNQASENFKKDLEKGMEAEGKLEKVFQELPQAGRYQELQQRVLGTPKEFMFKPPHMRRKVWHRDGLIDKERMEIWADEQKKDFIVSVMFNTRKLMHSRGNAIGATVVDCMLWLCKEPAAQQLAKFEQNKQRFEVRFDGDELETAPEFGRNRNIQFLSGRSPWEFLYVVHKAYEARVSKGEGKKKRETFWEAHGLPARLRRKLVPIVRVFERAEKEHAESKGLMKVDIGKEVREEFPGLWKMDGEETFEDLVREEGGMTDSMMDLPSNSERLLKQTLGGLVRKPLSETSLVRTFKAPGKLAERATAARKYAQKIERRIRKTPIRKSIDRYIPQTATKAPPIRKVVGELAMFKSVTADAGFTITKFPAPWRSTGVEAGGDPLNATQRPTTDTGGDGQRIHKLISNSPESAPIRETAGDPETRASEHTAKRESVIRLDDQRVSRQKSPSHHGAEDHGQTGRKTAEGFRSEWWDKPHTFAYKMMRKKEVKNLDGRIGERLGNKNPRSRSPSVRQAKLRDEDDDEGVDYDEIERSRERDIDEMGYRQPTIKRLDTTALSWKGEPTKLMVARMRSEKRRRGMVRSGDWEPVVRTVPAPPIVRRVKGDPVKEWEDAEAERESADWWDAAANASQDSELLHPRTRRRVGNVQTVVKKSVPVATEYRPQDAIKPRNEPVDNWANEGDVGRRRRLMSGGIETPAMARRKKESSERLKENILQLLGNL